MESKTSDSPDVELTSDKFDDLDIDQKTKKVLKSKGYVYLTKVQSKVLPLALSGKNLVIQSPTGSGKTLCFLLPAVKHLFDEGYSGNLPIDANLLGCICLAPTRELASQIALQMKDLATPLKLNSGCCIGGVRDKYDKKNANRLHILTGTPGRILALLSSQSLPDTYNIKMLILDEADRLIDIGFRNDIISIVDFLPRDLQFMFFSATIKSSLKELCNILLQDVSYELVCLGADVDAVSESKLRQEYIVMPPKLKLAALFYILSKNQNHRVIVFLSTCKLVRFMYEVFKRLIPAIPMTELHGKQSQNKRLTQFTRFAVKQNHGCIFTTDLAARGIDFPAIDIVIQFDLPDSISTYTHRVGRTGRLSTEGFRNYGRSIIFINESETEFVTKIKSNGISVHNQTKLCTPLIQKRENYVTRKMQAILAKESWIKEMAQRSIIAHLRYITTRSCVKVRNKDITEEISQLALSMGLPYSPNIQLVDNDQKNENNYTNQNSQNNHSNSNNSTNGINGTNGTSGTSGTNGMNESYLSNSTNGVNVGKKSKLEKLKSKIKSKKLMNKKLMDSKLDDKSEENKDSSDKGDGQDREKEKDSEESSRTVREDEEDQEPDEVEECEEHEEDAEEESLSDEDYEQEYDMNDDDVEVSEDEVDEEEEEEDDILFLSNKDVENDIEIYNNQLQRNAERDIKKLLTSTRNKLRLNRRGVAKLRGVVTLREAEKNHVFFSEDDEEDDVEVEKQQYIEELQKNVSEKDKYDKLEYNQIKREHKRSKKY